MDLPSRLPPGSVQDADRPCVFWYPRGERVIVDAAQYAKPDQRDAQIARLEQALTAIARLVSDVLVEQSMKSGTVYEEMSA